ncbi:MAG: hypothetical protein O7C58_08165 [Rickettsia endosymbiont of Ixodes persulcatus]|nr:hypothetical protein [Rickettsia endosymbiont of Ixodes persulcatus]
MKTGAIIDVIGGSAIFLIGTFFSIIILMGGFANSITIRFDDSSPIHSKTFLYQFAIFNIDVMNKY